MRETKFRGKRINSGEWIYGCLVNDIGYGVCIMPSPWYSTVIFEDDETTFHVERDGRAIGGCFPVITESVGQYTGFKDKNGKEIYDGDYIQHLDEKMKVFFNESMGSWDLEYEGGDCINLVDEDGWDAEDFEVIGNIYETK